MLWFQNDYTEGAHPRVLEHLVQTNMEKLPGYGSDAYCAAAGEKIRTACGCPEAEVFFISGGTQANAVVISTMLQSYQAVAAAKTGHVNFHEAGAIEYTGHKVLEVPSREGKILPEGLAQYLADFYADANHEHMAFPGMVYISHPTEYGTLYTREELKAISAICRSYEIPLFLDGARLGYGLASRTTDVTLPLVAECCDVFYIGGTKVGALCGEAVVFPRHNAPRHFLTMVKQRGAMLAKGRLLGVQFKAMLEDGLYLDMGRHANEMAFRLRDGMAALGYTFPVPSPTNQQFPVLPNTVAKQLEEMGYAFEAQEDVDDAHTLVRFVTSWATPAEAVEQFLKDLASCK